MIDAMGHCGPVLVLHVTIRVRQRSVAPVLRKECGLGPCPRVAVVLVVASVARASTRHKGASHV